MIGSKVALVIGTGAVIGVMGENILKKARSLGPQSPINGSVKPRQTIEVPLKHRESLPWDHKFAE